MHHNYLWASSAHNSTLQLLATDFCGSVTFDSQSSVYMLRIDLISFLIA